MTDLAIYDMDRTVTRYATFTPFLLYCAAKRAPWRLALAPLAALSMLAYAGKAIDRARLKEINHRLLLGHRRTQKELAPLLAGFADRTLRTNIRPGARAAVARDKAEGRRVVMATASYRFYAAEIARRLGFDDCIGTDTILGLDQEVHAKIDGANCYGPAKLAMIEAWLAREGITRAHVRFYSDHASDLPVFDWADEAVAVNPHAPLRRLAAEQGWTVADWAKLDEVRPLFDDLGRSGFTLPVRVRRAAVPIRGINMPETKPTADADVTKDWQATQGQKSSATRLRLFAAIAWVIAIGTEIAGVVMLRQHKFDHGNLPLLIGLLVVIAVFAIAGSLMWKAANKQDPARQSDSARFFFQNQLGAIITVIAFLPLIVLIFMDKDMDPKNKKIAGGIGVVLAAAATLIGVDFNPPSVEKYTKDMNTCAAQIKAGQPTTACSPEVAAQAKAIAQDSATVAEATKDAAHPAGQDVVYWIAPENGAKTSATPHVFHICQGVSPLNGKTVNHGSVTEAYAENATRITKQIAMEQGQCGFAKPKESAPAA